MLPLVMSLLSEVITRPDESILSGHDGGILSPLPKRVRQPLLRCDRCGTFQRRDTPSNICGTCCKGATPIPVDDNAIHRI